MNNEGIGFNIGRFWVSLFNYDNFCGIWLSMGIDKNMNCFTIQFQFLWLQLCIGYDLK